MAKIGKRKNKVGTTSYTAQVRRVGHPSITRSFPTKVAAEIWRTQTERRVSVSTVGQSERMTFTDLLKEVEPRLSSSYAAALEYWREQFGSLRLSKITPSLIDTHRDALLAEQCSSRGHKTTRLRSPRTVWAYLQELSGIFGIAVKQLHLIDENPVAKVKRPSLPKGRNRFLSDDEIRTLLGACRLSDSTSLYAFVLLLLTTGCRRGEAYAMEWTDIDVERRWVTLPKTKNGTARGIPLTQSALDTLMALPRDDSGLVFPSELTAAFRTAVKRSDIDDFRLHDLRHTSASLLVRAGHSLFEVGRLLGHQDPRMTARYSHVAQGTTAAMVDRVMSDIK